MNSADMTPLARLWRGRVEKHLMDHPDGLLQPLTLGLQYVDDCGGLNDPDAAAELAGLQARVQELEARLSAAQVERASWRRLGARRKARPAPVDVAAASHEAADGGGWQPRTEAAP